MFDTTIAIDGIDDVQGHLLFLVVGVVAGASLLSGCITPCPPKEEKNENTSSKPRPRS